VQTIAKSYGTECHVILIPSSLRDKKSGFQANAREWRRTVSENILDAKVANAGKGSYIATAHHREDQLEGLLLKFVRGVHISNFLPVGFAYIKRFWLRSP
jgi:tRNA(Ile)-lysidine synthase TilS/MesJ